MTFRSLRLAAFITGCGTLSGTGAAAYASSETIFRCDDGTDFRLAVRGENAVLHLDEELEISLVKSRFSYGERFVNDEMTLIVDGNRAVIALIANSGLITCLKDRPERKKE